MIHTNCQEIRNCLLADRNGQAIGAMNGTGC